MKLILDSEKVLNLINKYYSEVLDIDGYAVFQSDKEYSGYDRLESDILVPRIVFYGITNVLGQKNNISIRIHDLDIKNIVEYYIEKEGYSSYNFYIDKGSHRKEESRYGDPKFINRPYFNGIEIEVIKNNNINKMR